MKYITSELNDWAIRKIQAEYADDISLLIGHSHWKIKPDGDQVAFNYFIPRTERGYKLARTFIIDGIGYDLFPMSWERVGGLAQLNEGLTTCLAEGVILYARSEAERQKFIRLQDLLNRNLKNPEFTYKKGLEKISITMDLYKNMLFEGDTGQVRKASGYIMSYLAQAVAAANGTYLKRGPEEQMAALRQMQQLPDRILDFCLLIIKAKTVPEIRHACWQLIHSVRNFFADRAPQEKPVCNDIDYKNLASWYEEGIYTFRRIDYYCEQKDTLNTFAWCCLMQQEFDYLHEEFGLAAMDLMGFYDPDHLAGIRRQAVEIQQYIVSQIEHHGVTLAEYANLDQFLLADS